MSEALRILQDELQAQLNRLHNEVRRFYKKEPVVTLVLRVPELPNSELILTNDPDQEEVIAIIRRSMGPHCDGCGFAIDPEMCWCGEGKHDAPGDGGHSFVPMGCDCFRGKSK